MPTVRINGNIRTLQKMEWAGKLTLSADGKIERLATVPEEALAAIERQIAKGAIEGSVVLPNGKRFDYFVDRSPG
ncbi:hypothetical protein AYO44_08375 [Planctomycetaceae bacterium SCGC AG-212-F19]|nr:hypothetical protein AYO44_08375 [Planctomycetaceae bacterium SCGC AG-212-F19]